MSRYLVYGLIDPTTLLIRYVGKSSSGLRRPHDHAAPALLAKDLTHKGNWIRALLATGRRYDVVVLESPERGALSDAERWWIAYGRACGWPLTNLTDGGEGLLGMKHSPATKAKMSAAKRGHAVTSETRAKISAKQHGQKESLETRAKRSAAFQQRSPETRRKMTEWERTSEYGAKISAANKGRRLVPSQKLIASWTPERRAEQSARLKEQWRIKKCAT